MPPRRSALLQYRPRARYAPQRPIAPGMRYGLAPTCSLYPCCLPGASWIPTVHWFCVILALFHVKQQGKPTALLSSARTNTETRLCKLCHILAAGDVSSSCVSPLLQFIYPPQRFCSFSPGLFAKRPTSPRRSALCSTAYARGTRRSALILRKTRETRTGRAEKPAGAAISIAHSFLQGAG